MGVVYRAERVQLGRTVAVKFLDTALAGDENSRARFEREARAMSRLSHPHCVSVIDFGVAETPFIVMDFVTGQPLVALIRSRPIRAERAVNVMRQVAAGLAHAHRHDIIHRDIKPANIMLTEVTGTGDFVRILDFGLAKLRGASSLSSANVVVGTPSYMSPEQGRGKAIDARSDIYSAGVVFYELLTGKKPFVADDAFETLRMHQQDPVPLLGEIRGTDELRISLDAVLQKAMAKKPGNRYQTALALGDAMARILETSQDRRRPRGRRSSRIRDAARQSTQLLAQVDAEEIALEAGESADDLSVGLDEPTETTRRMGRFSWLAIICLIAAAGLLVLNSRTRNNPEKDRQAAAALAKSQAQASAQQSVDSKDDAKDDENGTVVATTSPIDAGVAADSGVPLASIDTAADAGIGAGLIDASVEALATSDAGDADELLIIDDIDGVDDIDDIDDVDDGDEASEGLTPPSGRGDKKTPTLTEAKELLRRKRFGAAVSVLRKMLREQPKNAAFHRLLGNAYFGRGSRRLGLLSYRRAITLSPRYRTFKSINENAIDALALKRDRGFAERFILKTLGKTATSPLRVASRSHRSEIVRKRSASLLKRLR